MDVIDLTPADEIAIEKELCKRSLAEFAKCAWHVLEPSAELHWGWALDAICEHLEAVTHGEIKRLLINVPPGMMKSLLTSVIWPAWEWGPRGEQWLRYLGTSHKQDIALRDATKCRRLIQSDWFQNRWKVELTSDQNSKIKFENSRTGFREAMAFTSMTGARGDRVLLDDPLSVDDANSDAELQKAALTFTEALPTRVNNKNSAIVVIMQRLHQRDTSGIILEHDLPYTHLMLPMRFEPERKCYTNIGFEDPRVKDGELLFPERFDEAEVDALEKTLKSVGGSYAVAGQFQQRPSPRGGGLMKEEWFNIIPDVPSDVIRWVRAWDLAATENSRAARTAGVKMGITPAGRYVIEHVVKEQYSPAKVEELIYETAWRDGLDVYGSLPQDPGQAGKSQVRSLISMLAGLDYHSSPESGSKYTRALPFAAQVEAGNVDLVMGEWNGDFKRECSEFPTGKFKDQVDAASRAFGELLEPPANAAMFLSKKVRG